jgi:mono/diheme cytochrome c family protein
MQIRRGVIKWTGVALSLSLATAAVSGTQPSKRSESPDTQQIERGRYLVKITGCNVCHTPGYTQKAGKVPEKEWLTGDRLGWRGPWGTTYAGNLRTYISTFAAA